MKRMDTTQWWRVVLDSSGGVTSCKAVDAAGSDDGGGIFYIQALTLPQASKEAAAQYAKAVRGRNKRLGLCVCGGAKDRGYESCKSCRTRHRHSNETRSAKLHGLPQPIKPLPARAPELDLPRNIATRLSVLIEVQEAWMRNGTVAQFSKWLNSEIEAIRSKRSA
jgi:hypothetical protein